jgi:hypothetical protein
MRSLYGLGDPGDEDELEVEGEDEQDAEQEELEARAAAGEVCEDCGEEFTESNGSPALCQECFDEAEAQGVAHAPLSKFSLA